MPRGQGVEPIRMRSLKQALLLERWQPGKGSFDDKNETGSLSFFLLSRFHFGSLAKASLSIPNLNTAPHPQQQN